MGAFENALSEQSKGAVINLYGECLGKNRKLEAENKRLRVAVLDVIQRIEAWEDVVRTIIGCVPGHGMDLTQLRAALLYHAPADD